MGSHLTWLHVSDLHCDLQETLSRNVVIKALLADIDHLRATGLQPNLIFFTGDIANRGKPEEYEIAERTVLQPLLRTANLPPERLFLVPGNHDINRRTAARIVLPSPMQRTREGLTELMCSEDAGLFLQPMSGFAAIAPRYGMFGERSSGPMLSYSGVIPWCGHSVRIVGLNSSWLSSYHRESEGTVFDCGHLAIGEFQLRPHLSDGDLHIVLVHHPFDWLLESDRHLIETILGRTHCIVLRGHLHRPDVITNISCSGRLTCIPAGALYETRDSPNAYNISRLNLETGLLEVNMRVYNSRRECWQADTFSGPESMAGRMTTNVLLPWMPGSALDNLNEDVSYSLRSFTIAFGEQCLLDLIAFGLTRDDLLRLVEDEFRSHLNYFRFDLEEYPLPLRTEYILFLNKVGQAIQFNHLLSCTKDSAKLAAWTDILMLYRRATRLAYREDPRRLIYIEGSVARAAKLHLEIELRLQKYFQKFCGMPGIVLNAEEQKILGSATPTQIDLERVLHYLRSSARARTEAEETLCLLVEHDIEESRAIEAMTTSLELSLHNLHKTIMLCPPTEGMASGQRNGGG